MRNFLTLLLLGGLLFVGYRFVRDGGLDNDPTKAAERKQDAGGGDLVIDDDGAGASLVSSGNGGSGEAKAKTDKAAPKGAAGDGTATGDKTSKAEDSTPVGGERGAELCKALLEGRLAKVELDDGERVSLAMGSAGRFGLEVGLAMQGKKGADPRAIAAAGAAMRGKAALRLQSAAFTALVASRPAVAPMALAGRNDALSGRAAISAVRSLAGAAERLPPVARVETLSALVDAMTRGEVRIWQEHYKTLETAYRALQKALKIVVFNPRGGWKSEFRRVAKNATLDRICNEFQRKTGNPMSPGLLVRVNRMRSARSLRAGQKLRIPVERIHVVVDKSTHSMKVYLGETLIRLYDCGLGENDCTPEIEFEVEDKLLDPPWTNPKTGETWAAGDPRNVIGRYFVKLKDPKGEHLRFGIHGTDDQPSIGSDSSLGCVRLRAASIEQVFDYLPRGTKVLVRR